MVKPIFGLYWTDNMISVQACDQSIVPPKPNTPAVMQMLYDLNGEFKIYRFIEIVPGTEQIEQTLCLVSFKYTNEITVKVNIYENIILQNINDSFVVDRFPLSWFGLTTVPSNSLSFIIAYDRAMSILS